MKESESLRNRIMDPGKGRGIGLFLPGCQLPKEQRQPRGSKDPGVPLPLSNTDTRVLRPSPFSLGPVRGMPGSCYCGDPALPVVRLKEPLSEVCFLRGAAWGSLGGHRIGLKSERGLRDTL